MREAHAIILATVTAAYLVGGSPLASQAPDATGLHFLHSLDSLQRANPKLYQARRTLAVLGVQMTLGRMGFGQGGFSGLPDSATANAVRLFERTRRLPITGNLFTPATYSRLASEGNVMTRSETRPSLGLKLFTWGDGVLTAEGPWLMDGEPDAFMKVDIFCSRDATSYFGASSTSGECALYWARLGPGFMTARELMILSEHFAVERWDQSEILSRPLDDPCTRYLLRINRIQQSVVMTRSAISRSDNCKGFEVRDVVTRLGGSTDRVRDDDRRGQCCDSVQLRASGTDCVGFATPVSPRGDPRRRLTSA